MSPAPTTSASFDFNSYIIADPLVNHSSGLSRDLTRQEVDIDPDSPSNPQSAETTPPPVESAAEEKVQTPILDTLRPRVAPGLVLPSSYPAPRPTSEFGSCAPNSSGIFEPLPLTAPVQWGNLHNPYGLYTPLTENLPMTGETYLGVSYNVPLPSASGLMDSGLGQSDHPYFTPAQLASQDQSLIQPRPVPSIDNTDQSIHSSPEVLSSIEGTTTLASSPQLIYVPRPLGLVRNSSTPKVGQNRRRSATTNTFSTSTPATQPSSYQAYASGYPYPTLSHKSGLVRQPSAPMMSSGYNMIPNHHPHPPPLPQQVRCVVGKRLFHPSPAILSPPVNADFNQLSYESGTALFNPAYGYGTYGNDGFGLGMEQKPARFKPTKEQLETLIKSYEENK